METIWLQQVLYQKPRQIEWVDVFFIIKMLDKKIISWLMLTKEEQQLVKDFYNNQDFQPKKKWLTKLTITNDFHKIELFNELYNSIARSVSEIIEQKEGQKMNENSDEFNQLVRVRFFIETGKYPEEYLVNIFSK